MSKIGQSMETKSRLVVAESERGGIEHDRLMGRVFFQGKEHVWELNVVRDCTTP